MPKHADGSGRKRWKQVQSTLSAEETRALERVMVRHGFRQASRAMLWATLILDGRHDLAREVQGHAARDRALERRTPRVVYEHRDD